MNITMAIRSFDYDDEFLSTHCTKVATPKPVVDRLLWFHTVPDMSMCIH
jgi:hypothetical protein